MLNNVYIFTSYLYCLHLLPFPFIFPQALLSSSCCTHYMQYIQIRTVCISCYKSSREHHVPVPVTYYYPLTYHPILFFTLYLTAMQGCHTSGQSEVVLHIGSHDSLYGLDIVGRLHLLQLLRRYKRIMLSFPLP